MWAIEAADAKGFSASNRRCEDALAGHCVELRPEECVMNWDRIEGNWKQLTGKVKEQWGKLTEDDLTVIGGKQDQLVGRIQERYGIAKDEAERQVNSWVNRM
jgi:uncharacterized protein YjbJ (UPF0337 family)